MWNNFEHQIWKKIKAHDLDKKKLLLTISGGLDSMVLLDVFASLKLKNIKVLHFHHGEFENRDFRDQAQKNIEDYCRHKKIELIFEKSDQQLSSESDCRYARKKFFDLQKSTDSVFVTGHHLDDLLETRLIKMVRGTGVDGLNAFMEYNGEIFRPLLDFSKKEILEHAITQKIKWVDDPTNLESDYLRNWIRNQWLPALNDKHPGGVENLAKSIERLLEFDDHLTDQLTFSGDEIQIPRLWFFGLSTKDQLKVLSKVASSFKNNEISEGNLQEINKRLDKNQKEHIFELYSMNWVLNAQQIVVRFKI